jgi:abelson tyrosine-protein kinase 1
MEALISEIKGNIHTRAATAETAPSPGISPVTRNATEGSLPVKHAITSLNPDEVTVLLQTCRERQNEQDLAHDAEDLRQVMRSALQAGSDAEIIDVLQVSRHEMPEAMKTLQRALEKEVEKERDTEQSLIEDVDVFSEEAEPLEGLSSSQSSGSSCSKLRADSTASARARSSRDTLDREFLESGIEALRRMSEGVKLTLPSWTITKWEVDREEKIGVGFFSDVYKGTWREMAVAIKVLAPTTPRKLFVHEIEIWKTLSHPNVLKLFGASSTTAEPPWFFVSPYMKHGSLVRYLKNLDAHSPVNLLKMIYEVAMGMAYLHGMEVLHGDLKVSWCT